MTPEDAFRAGSRRHEVDLLRASIIRQHGCRHRPLASPVSQGLRPRVRGRRPAPRGGPAAYGRNQERRRHRDGRACPGTGAQHPAPPRERQAGGHPAPVVICAMESPEAEQVEMPISGHWPGFSGQGRLTLSWTGSSVSAVISHRATLRGSRGAARLRIGGKHWVMPLGARPTLTLDALVPWIVHGAQRCHGRVDRAAQREPV